MSDLIGRTLGHYRIVEKIGAGGMGVVYRAHDERLDRDVAIKVLPEEVAQDAERLARFEREAKLLASLNHPNIATLHGLEEDDGRCFLVMEVVEGESLATVLARGAIPFDEALPIALQITEALEAAHERGIIHRDLKPANVMVSAEGKVKVLDFGLAKAFDPEASGPQSPESIAESPTITAEMTRAGTLLGTAAYMSPEQARGRAVDKRADVWAFGCVLWEMLTGTRAFAGTTSTETLAAIIKDEPAWDEISPETVRPIQRLLRRCLTKDPRDRLHDIADARIELQAAMDPAATRQVEEAPSHRPSAIRIAIPWILAATTIAAVLGLISSGRRPTRDLTNNGRTPALTRFAIETRGEQRVVVNRDTPLFAVSADGRRIAWLGGVEPNRRIFTRRLDETEIRPVPGTEGATQYIMLLSPDGKEICFDRDDTLWKLPVVGGTPTALIHGTGTKHLIFSGDWGSDDTIVLQSRMGLMRIPAAGGAAIQLTNSDRNAGEPIHWNPRIFSDGSGLLFTVGVVPPRVEMMRYASGERRKVLENAMVAWYLPTGHLLFGRDRTVFSAPVDPENFEIIGEPRPVLSDVEPLPGPSRVGPQLAVADDGTLVYVPFQGTVDQRLAWVSTEADIELIDVPPAGYSGPSISPDGSMVAVWKSTGRATGLQIFDFDRGVLERLTGGETHANCFAWSPDGKQLAFSSSYEPRGEISAVTIGIEEVPHLLVRHQTPAVVEDWSPDGAHLLYSASVPGEPSQRALYLLPVGEQGAEPAPWVVGEYRLGMAAFSPDSRWIAYVSMEEGREEVFVRETRSGRIGSGQKHKVSRAGGWSPIWSPSGEEIFFRNAAGDSILSAAIRTDPVLEIGEESVVVGGLRLPRRNWGYHQGIFDISSDGSRFLTVVETGGPESLQLVVVRNWFEELKRLVPTD